MSQLYKQAIGIDMAKDKFDACFSVIDSSQQVTIRATRSFANTPAGFAALWTWSARHQRPGLPLVFVVEATGVYHEQLCWQLHQQQARVAVVLANKARQYARSLGLKSKNDRIDAKGLARMGCQQALKPWQPLPAVFYRLRTLSREMESLHHYKSMLTNQLHALAHSRQPEKSTIRRLEQQQALLEKQLEAIKKEIAAVVEADAKLKERVARLLQVKGLGLVSVVTVLAETGGFALFENQRQLVSFAGYDVVESQSGKRAGKTRISKQGNSHIRRILHLPAFSVVRLQEPAFARLHERLLAKGKTKMQAYVAVQRKLLVLIYTLWKNEQEYKPALQGADGGEMAAEKELKKIAPAKARATRDELAGIKPAKALLLSQS